MVEQRGDGSYDELQGQRALSQWDNEGGADPGVPIVYRHASRLSQPSVYTGKEV
jgi:hypothetical protein